VSEAVDLLDDLAWRGLAGRKKAEQPDQQDRSSAT